MDTIADSLAIESALTTLCPDWDNALVTVEHYLPGGYRNKNFCISYNQRRYVLRLPGASTGANFEREVTRLAELAKLFPVTDEFTLEVPQVAASDQATGALLTRWCDAPLLAQCSGVSAETLGTYLALLHARLAHLPAKATSIVVAADHLNQQIQFDLATAVGSTARASALFSQLPQSTQTVVPCHLDLNPWNLLSGPQQWMTLDWETLAYGDPLFDLVTLCDGYLREHSFNEDSEAFALSALDAYHATSNTYPGGDSENALAQARVLYQWREFSWAAAQLAKGNRREEVVTQRDFFAAKLIEQGFETSLETAGE